MTGVEEVRIVGRDQVGIIAETVIGERKLRYYLTDCCRASSKGTGGSPTGVCCHACYQPVPAALGGVVDQETADAALALAVAACARFGAEMPDQTAATLLAPGLFLLGREGVNADGQPIRPSQRYALVLDEYRVTPRSKVSGYIYRRNGDGIPVVVAWRAGHAGRLAGEVTAAARLRLIEVGDQHLPVVR